MRPVLTPSSCGLFAFVLGLTLAACGPVAATPCGPSSCPGCCSASGECLGGTNLNACGTEGGACTACAANLVCSVGSCVPFDGGSYDAAFPDRPDAHVLDSGVYDAGRPDAGADGGTDGGRSDAGPADASVSYAASVAPIFITRCNSCHSWSYASVVNVAASSACGGKLIVPGNAATSVIYAKVAGVPPCGGPMPQGGPSLSTAESNALAGWISQGALNN